MYGSLFPGEAVRLLSLADEACWQVGKMEDPTTARLGEPLYRFIPRSVWGNIVDGWQAEQQRLHSWQLPFYSHQNRYAVLAISDFHPSWL